MPLTTCPDCQREISTLAPSCPHCGRPTAAALTQTPTTPPLPQHEETLWRGTPAWALLAGHIAGIALTLIVVPLITYFAAKRALDLESGERIISTGWLITAAIVIIQVIVFAVALLRLRSTVYTITNQRVMIETGLLTKALSEIDLRYVDDTQFIQSFTQRILGIGNVTLVSSDKTTPVYVLRSIRDPRNVREMIRSHAYRVSQRQVFTRAT